MSLTLTCWTLLALQANAVEAADGGAQPDNAAVVLEQYDEWLDDLQNTQVTTASRVAERLDESPGSITVITRQQIEDTNAQTLRDVLNLYVPGLDVVPTFFRYGDRVSEGIYSRGLLSDFSQQVLILYNGLNKMTDATFGSHYPAMEFTLENIERVEVSRTPIPLYGSGAITVINLITRDQSVNGVSVNANVGSSERGGFGHARRMSVLGGHDVGPVHVGAFAQYYEDLGQPHPEPTANGGFTGDSKTLKDGTKGAANAMVHLKTLDGKFSAQAWYKVTNKDAFLSGQVPSQSIDLYNYNGQVLLLGAKYEPIDGLTFSVGGMLSRWLNTVDFAGLPYPADLSQYDVFGEATYLKRFTLAGQHTLLAGAKFEREGQYASSVPGWTGHDFDYSASIPLAPNVSRSVGSLYVEDTWEPLSQLSVQGGARVDGYFGYGGTLDTAGNPVANSVATEFTANPRAAISYTPNKVFTAKALYASAVRPPSIYEKLGVALVPLVGSPSVRSEQVQTVEVTAIVKVGGFKAQLTPFLQLFNNKIEYLPDAAGTTFTATNNGRTRVLGVDLAASYYFTPRTSVFANGTFFDSFDEKSGTKTPYLPSLYVNAGANWWVLDQLNVNVNATLRGPRTLPDTLPINASLQHVNVMLNASVAWQFNKQGRVWLLAENITDARNYVPLSVDGFVVPFRGRTFTVGASYAFGESAR